MKLRIKLLFLFFVVLSTLVAQPLATDVHKQGKRPKIGLVLSGGGAKGLAHIGVLKVLEEAGIVPDYIAGTSMGSIIGGLYAAGYTAAEISEINHSLSWGDFLTNIIPMDQVSMEQKHDYGRYVAEFPVRGTKIYLPSGIIESQPFWQLFHNLTWPVAGINNFDSLPIPYRCCATEILKGNVKTFKDASLPTSMRASMAIPGFFSPVVEADTIVYVDGGVGRNFPVQEVLDMGADIVIGVYVGAMEALDPMMARSFDKILMQTAFYAGLKESREVMDKCDILIIPDLHGLGSQSFERGKEIEKYGYITALDFKERLKNLADSLNSFGPPPIVARPDPQKKYVVKEIIVRGTRNVTPAFVAAKSWIQPGDTVSSETMNRSMENIFGTLYFDRLAYHFEPAEKGHNLVFEPQEKEPQLLKGAIQANNFWGPSLLLNYTHNSFLSKESRFITRLEISKIPRLYVSHMQFMGKRQRQSYELALFADADEIPIYMTTFKIGNIQESSYGALFALNSSINNNNQLSLGATFGVVSLHTTNSFKVLFPETSLESLHYGGIKFWCEFRKNSLDRHYFPRQGSKIEAKLLFGPKPFLEVSHLEGAGILDSVNVPDNYAKLSFSYERHLTFGKHFTWMFGTDVRLVTKKAPDFDVSYVGASDYTTRARDVAFYGFGYREGNVPNFVIAKTEMRAKVWSEFYSMARINYFQGASKELDVVDRAFDPEYDVFGYAAGLGYNSIAGPLTVWVSSNTMNKNVWWYFCFGYNF